MGGSTNTVLHLLAAATPGKNDEIKPANGTLFCELWPAIRDEHSPLLQDAGNLLIEEDSASDTPALPQQYRRLAAAWQPPECPAPVRQAPVELPEARDFIEFQWAGEGARLTGNLVHRLLQQIAESGIPQWQQEGGMALQEDWCRQQLVSDGVLGAKAEAIVSRVSQAIGNCLDSKHGKWLLGPRESAECEYALTAVLDNQPTNLVLDRTFVDDGTRWIVDYKTSSHSGGDLEGFVQNEADRYREQLGRYRQALEINETRPIRTALYFPLLDRFCEI